MKFKSIVTVRFATFLMASLLVGCSSNNKMDGNPNQSAQNQKTQQEAANATRKMKKDSKYLAYKAGQAAKELERKAEAAGKGVKEGWDGQSNGTLNLNSASESQLQSLPGITRKEAHEIVRERPYTSKDQLVSKRIVSQKEFNEIEGKISVK